MAVESTIPFNGSGFLDPDFEPPLNTTVTNPSAGVLTFTSSTGTIEGLGLSDSPDSPISSSVRVSASVDDLQANTGSGNDRLFIGGDMTNSSVELGSGTDNLVVDGNTSSSGITSDTGRDVLAFRGSVTNSFIDSGADDDLVVFYGNVNGAVVDLGTGSDQVRFFSDITNTQLDLGNDGQVDKVTIADPLADTTGLVIEGAGAEDVLFIGTSQYSYEGNYTWENINDPTDQKIFGP